jgi:hypothetical protein
MTKTVAIMMVLVFVVAALGGGVIAYWLKGSGTSPRVTIHVDKIRDLSDLTTVEYQISSWAEQEYKSNIGLMKVVSDYLIIVCTGTIRGSVDLSEGKATMKVDDLLHEISIHFERGAVKISNVALLPGDSGIVNISCREKVPKFGFTKGTTEKERKELKAIAERKIREAAINSGIVEKTMKNAGTVLERFCGGFGYKIVVTFDDKAYDPGDK